MKLLTLTRIETGDEGTFGELRDENNKLIAVTAELPKYAGDPDTENERQTDCIPAGDYEVAMMPSGKYGRAYQIKNIPGRSHVLVHSGNVAGDITKGYKSDVEGCIVLGTTFGTLYGQKAVLNSKTALDNFHRDMANQPFMLSIVEEF